MCPLPAFRKCCDSRKAPFLVGPAGRDSLADVR